MLYVMHDVYCECCRGPKIYGRGGGGGGGGGGWNMEVRSKFVMTDLPAPLICKVHVAIAIGIQSVGITFASFYILFLWHAWATLARP